MAETTPVTVLTGFLGAGKSTLLNQVLVHPALAGCAILVNEVGTIAVRHSLVRQVGAAPILLRTGCLCCTARSDLERVLREFLPYARRGEISRIVIETTGLADPAAILATLRRDSVASIAYRPDSIITVVDTLNGESTLNAHPEAVRQVEAADWIVLSKTDLAGASGLMARLRKLNRRAPVLTARNVLSAPGSVFG